MSIRRLRCSAQGNAHGGMLTRLARVDWCRAERFVPRDNPTAEGRTTKEIRRSLKRYLARQIHHALTAATRVERTSCDMTRATPSLA